MVITTKKNVEKRPRTRANRHVGKIWLFVFSIFLVVINLANSTIEPMLGSLAPMFRAALIVSTVWNVILLGAIATGHGWARYTLSAFLFAFVVSQVLFIVNIIEKHPSLKGEPIHLLAIILCANLFVSAYLTFSADIRQICHHVID